MIYNNERPLVRRQQEQIPLSNIQQVQARTSTYLEHWLKLGTLQIKSAAFGFTIYFDDADNPDEMQRRIMGQVKKVRREETNTDLQRLMEAAMNGATAETMRRDQELPVEHVVAPGLLRWLFPENPNIDLDGLC